MRGEGSHGGGGAHKRIGVHKPTAAKARIRALLQLSSWMLACETVDKLAWRTEPESSSFEKACPELCRRGGLRGISPNDPHQNPPSPPFSRTVDFPVRRGRHP